ncbi:MULTISPECIES: gas vesicle protein [Streptomyces]|uniref:Gas vesicle protein n=1 Tax=Streptomyces lycii TaxID=2654337 RepID=A0ABQ7FGT8_9ACTN|nr:MULTISPECIES: gas vesicle protein [Streptomyces]KAF4407173.1 gas vesicle protein [Streptomyces lycii]PGH51130.1 gas vesicle protein [Streptomyces sp. Ru87]
MTDKSENTDKSAADRPKSGPTAVEVLRTAGAQLAELTGLRPEAVTRFERTGDGWLIEAEVLELARVPDTMSLMASYEVTTDPDGQLTGYRRTRRYERGRADRR